MSEMDYRSVITVDAAVRSGKPCVRGMRVTVADVLDLLADDLDVHTVIEEYPYLTVEDVKACLAFAAERERRTSFRSA